ncbi:hypothetical protein GCM10015535_26760 [Streptomyces gelaticus]|uniref:Monooxygenase n=1 Tax=Streptomyces gelaticus TaxID=285446 RepID=A0ABQ2VY27_9ACTN|nr:hypothetical protein GCM10015535_26760 [Streptomyces gelaticus]
MVGGSIAGCAMAIAGARAGADVTVHERSDGTLQDRGFGIVIPPPLHQELVAGGYLGADMPTAPVATRVWLARAPGRRTARELARQQAPVAACNWGLLWRALRANAQGGTYHRGRPVGSVGRAASGGALIRTADGEREYDIVVGADGHRSVTRELLAPGVRPVPAGYLVWRGTIPATALSERSAEGARLVGLGRRLGRAFVENTPDWPALGPAEVEALSRAALDGDDSYLYGSVQRQ